MFAASIILLAENLFLQFVAINFHEKALAERLGLNRLALKALDRLSNAQPPNVKKPAHHKHNSYGGSASMDPFHTPQRGHKNGQTTTIDGVPLLAESYPPLSDRHDNRRSNIRRRKEHKAMASVIVDQVPFH